MDGIKILIVVVLVGIVASLGKALFHMSSGGSDHAGHSAMMARALSVRIGLSIAAVRSADDRLVFRRYLASRRRLKQVGYHAAAGTPCRP